MADIFKNRGSLLFEVESRFGSTNSTFLARPVCWKLPFILSMIVENYDLLCYDSLRWKETISIIIHSIIIQFIDTWNLQSFCRVTFPRGSFWIRWNFAKLENLKKRGVERGVCSRVSFEIISKFGSNLINWNFCFFASFNYFNSRLSKFVERASQSSLGSAWRSPRYLQNVSRSTEIEIVQRIKAKA